MVEVKIVKTKKQAKEFFKFVDFLYGDCKQYCPSYKKFEYKLFSHKKNPSLNKTNSKQNNTEEEVISNDLPNKEIDKNTFSDNN